MTSYDRKVFLYISMSLDGFIAGENDDISFLDAMDKEGLDYGYYDFVANVDTYIVGRKSYDKVMSMIGHFPQAKEYDCYVITRQDIPDTADITFYNEDIKALIQRLRSEPGKHIYCDGGGEIVKLLMDNDLIDEYIVSIIPTIVGKGKRLFMGGTAARVLDFVGSETYETGLVQVRYRRRR
ncbi:MAG: dihydrofolate reductase family protein [Bacteroidota bacterium]